MSVIDTPGATPADQDPRRNHWSESGRDELLRILMLILAFYCIAAPLIGLYAWLDVVSIWVPVGYLTAGIITVGGSIAAVLTLNLHERWRYVWFTGTQAMASTAIMLGTALQAPQIGITVLLSLFTIAAVAAQYMPMRLVAAGAVVVAALTVGLMAAVSNQLGMPVETPAQAVVSGLCFAFTLLQVASVNFIGARVRRTVAARNSALAEALQRVDTMARRDDLTGLLNRRAMLQLLAGEQARLRQDGLGVGIALLDVDHFKAINDRFGHLVGDEVLRCFAQVVAGALRNTDRLARYGGEEFLVLMVGVNSERRALQVAERFRSAVQIHDWSGIQEGLAVTVSIGVAVCRADDDGVEPVIGRADAALYRAKSGGRNQVR